MFWLLDYLKLYYDMDYFEIFVLGRGIFCCKIMSKEVLVII